MVSCLHVCKRSILCTQIVAYTCANGQFSVHRTTVVIQWFARGGHLRKWPEMSKFPTQTPAIHWHCIPVWNRSCFNWKQALSAARGCVFCLVFIVWCSRGCVYCLVFIVWCVYCLSAIWQRDCSSQRPPKLLYDGFLCQIEQVVLNCLYHQPLHSFTPFLFQWCLFIIRAPWHQI